MADQDIRDAASGERGADHPAADLIAAVLAVTPQRYNRVLHGTTPLHDQNGQRLPDRPDWGDPTPIAARQAVAVLRWVASNMRLGDDERVNLRALTDAIEAAR